MPVVTSLQPTTRSLSSSPSSSQLISPTNVPSTNTTRLGQRRYDAEVHLAHFYSLKSERRVGKVMLLLDADPDRERWDFSDKFICQWRETEEQTRDKCKVTLLLEADPDREQWDFMGKLICQWGETEEHTWNKCGLDSVLLYPGWRNPTREAGETYLPKVGPYPFIDCDSVGDSNQICKPASCCKAKRSTSSYCEDGSKCVTAVTMLALTSFISRGAT
jgi:hypothetical protein